MSKLHLVIGNQNYSSWSLRPWMAMTMSGLPFVHTVIPLDMPETKRLIGEHSGAGRVPILYHGKLKIWDSLAILEYLADAFPEKAFWPKGKEARAVARAVSSEMHSSFTALRNACPMNLRRPRKAVPMNDAIKTDVSRLETIWRDCRKSFGKGGPFLFGRFSNADAMFAPVVTRFETYDLPVSADTRDYMKAVMSTRAFAGWKEAALKETWIIASDEVD